MPRFDPTHNCYKQRNGKICYKHKWNKTKLDLSTFHTNKEHCTCYLRCVLGLFRALHTASIMGWIVLNTKVAVSVMYWCFTQRKLVPVLILKNINFSSNCFNQIMSCLVTSSYLLTVKPSIGRFNCIGARCHDTGQSPPSGKSVVILVVPSCSYKTSCSQGYHSPLIVLMEGQHLSILFVFFFSISLAPCV